MRAHTKTTIAALITAITLALAITATTATARNFRVSDKEFEVTWRALTFKTSSNTISCPITLLGRYVERTIPKLVGTQVGAIRHALPLNGAEPSPCTGATVTILNASLPWLIYYLGFIGALPRITAINISIVGIAFRIRTSNGIGCLVGTTSAEPALGEIRVGTGGRVEALEAEPNARIRLGGPFLCQLAGTSQFSGLGTVTDLPGLNALTITLI